MKSDIRWSLERTKRELLNLVRGEKCILGVQDGSMDPAEGIDCLMPFLHTFCEEVRQRDPDSRIFWGDDFDSYEKLGRTCSTHGRFPECRDEDGHSFYNVNYWDRDSAKVEAARPRCISAVSEAIRRDPIENSGEWNQVLRAFETARDAEHQSGSMTMDYILPIADNDTSLARDVYYALSSRSIIRNRDLNHVEEAIRRWNRR